MERGREGEGGLLQEPVPSPSPPNSCTLDPPLATVRSLVH